MQPERFVDLGIDPPKGVLLYGPPGTGKTLSARAVANRTDACFIRVIGSELVQKYVGEVSCALLVAMRTRVLWPAILIISAAAHSIGTPRTSKILAAASVVLILPMYLDTCVQFFPPKIKGARMIRELFEMARTKKACVIFFDEIDAVGGARFDDGAGGDNEVQRTMLELINQVCRFIACISFTSAATFKIFPTPGCSRTEPHGCATWLRKLVAK